MINKINYAITVFVLVKNQNGNIKKYECIAIQKNEKKVELVENEKREKIELHRVVKTVSTGKYQIIKGSILSEQ